MILLIKRCIELTFTKADWDELTYVTRGQEIIHEDPRLLRSLHFGDDDEKLYFSGNRKANRPRPRKFTKNY